MWPDKLISKRLKKIDSYFCEDVERRGVGWGGRIEEEPPFFYTCVG